MKVWGQDKSSIMWDSEIEICSFLRCFFHELKGMWQTLWSNYSPFLVWRMKPGNLWGLWPLGFEVLTSVVMKSSVFWVIIMWRQLEVSCRFGRTYGIHLQSWRVSQARSRQQAKQDSVVAFSTGPCRCVHTVLTKGPALPSPGTHQP
jgi:hypothetical protein